MEKRNSQLEELSKVTLTRCDDLYKVVNLLNKTLKRENLTFGLALDRENQENTIFTIYRT